MHQSMTPSFTGKGPLTFKIGLALCSVLVALLALFVLIQHISLLEAETELRGLVITSVQSTLSDYYFKANRFPASLAELSLPLAKDTELASLMNKLRYHLTSEGYTLSWTDGFDQTEGIKPHVISCPFPAPSDSEPLIPAVIPQSDLIE